MARHDDVVFTRAERARLAEVCMALGAKFPEFVHFATMRAVDELEGYARDAALIRAYYNGTLDDYVRQVSRFDEDPPRAPVWLVDPENYGH